MRHIQYPVHASSVFIHNIHDMYLTSFIYCTKTVLFNCCGSVIVNYANVLSLEKVVIVTRMLLSSKFFEFLVTFLHML